MKTTWKIAHGLLFMLWLCCWCGAPVHAQSQNAQEAQTQSEQIKQTRPSDWDVEDRLASPNLPAQTEQNKDDLAVLYDQAQKQSRDGNLEVAIATYERILQQDANYRDTAVKLEGVRKQLAQKQRDRFLEERYAEGLSAHKQRDWTRAIIAFEKVVAAEAGYRDARKRLNEAQRELDRESVDTIAARYYAEGVAAKNRKDIGGALAAFEKVQRLNPRYRNVQTLLAEVEQALSQTAALGEAPEWPASLPAGAVTPRADLDSLYELAATAVQRQDWLAAVVAFEKLQILQPNYRDVAQRLADARSRLNASVPLAGAGNTEEASATSIWSWAGGVALFFVLPLLGVAMFSPNARARYQLFRGNYTGAMQIYERQLALHPARTRLYAPLASLYLLLGRKDERALKVFKTVLQLNLPVPNRDEINSIVAQQYLTEGRTDSDAIEVLENALRSERERQLPSGQAS